MFYFTERMTCRKIEAFKEVSHGHIIVQSARANLFICYTYTINVTVKQATNLYKAGTSWPTVALDFTDFKRKCKSCHWTAEEQTNGLWSFANDHTHACTHKAHA